MEVLSGAFAEVEIKRVFVADIAEEASLPLEAVLSKDITPRPLQTVVQFQQ